MTSAEGRRIRWAPIVIEDEPSPELLNEMEVRLVASLDRLSGHFRESLELQGVLLASMIDQVYLGLMLHFPDVPDELRKERVRRANDRHAAWRESVASLAREGGPKIYRECGEVR